MLDWNIMATAKLCARPSARNDELLHRIIERADLLGLTAKGGWLLVHVDQHDLDAIMLHGPDSDVEDDADGEASHQFLRHTAGC